MAQVVEHLPSMHEAPWGVLKSQIPYHSYLTRKVVKDTVLFFNIYLR
jgi:hypothetical protein